MAATGARTSAPVTLDAQIALALESGNLSLAYQPILRLPDLDVFAVEALARLDVPGLEDLTPDIFLPVLFRLGMADEVSRWTLRTALSDLEVAAAQFDRPALGVAINLSPAQLRNGYELVACVEQELSSAGVDPERVTFEIVEDLSVPQRSLVAGTLASLRRMGVKLALDDFGTGRSSHEHLLDLDVDSIKIDSRFVSAASDDPVAHASTEALAGLGIALGLEVVAEGVPSATDLSWLHEIGCSGAQGSAIGAPQHVGTSRFHEQRIAVDPLSDRRSAEATLNFIEKELLEGARFSEKQAVAALNLLDTSDIDRKHKERIGWVRSWLVHVAEGGSSAVSDHEVTATRSLRTGAVGPAGLEFSRAAVAACHSNQMKATLRNVTETCALLAEDDWELSDRYRVLYNLSWLYADVTRTVDGANLIAGVFAAGDGYLPDHLTWVAGYTAATASIELLERGDVEPEALAEAHPEPLVVAMAHMLERIDLDATSPLIRRWPWVPMQIRARLVADAADWSSEAVASLVGQRDRAAGEALSEAYWDVALSEAQARAADVEEAIARSRQAIDVFAKSGFFKYRILHAWERQYEILRDVGDHNVVTQAQTEVLEMLRRDNFDKNIQMFGSLLDFDLQATLAAELAKTKEASGQA